MKAVQRLWTDAQKGSKSLRATGSLSHRQMSVSHTQNTAECTVQGYLHPFLFSTGMSRLTVIYIVLYDIVSRFVIIHLS